MPTLHQQVLNAHAKGQSIFYNTSGSKQAYQWGIKHLSAAEFLGFTLTLPNGNVLLRKSCLLVDFSEETITQLHKGEELKLIPLKTL